jgi:hypothetical protein
MTNPLAWVVVGVTCASMWGVGYSFLAPASGIFKPSTLKCVVSLCLRAYRRHCDRTATAPAAVRSCGC